jgi:hypothetical protein
MPIAIDDVNKACSILNIFITDLNCERRDVNVYIVYAVCIFEIKMHGFYFYSHYQLYVYMSFIHN